LLTHQASAADIAIRIWDGATGTDATALANKLTVAAAYTTGLDTVPELTAYSGEGAAQAARDFLATVT